MFEVRYFNLEFFFYYIYHFFYDLFTTFGTPEAGFFTDRFIFWSKFMIFSSGLLLSIAVAYLAYKLVKLRRIESEFYLSLTVPPDVAETKPKNIRWERVLKFMESANPSDWKQAIIESDIILDELLQLIGYKGESVGDRLMQVEKGDWQYLDEAWEAHKFRNRLAHEGVELSEREARRIIGLFEKVFRELVYI